MRAAPPTPIIIFRWRDLFKKSGQHRYGFTFTLKVGWCSWSSRLLNTQKVLGSNPSLITFLSFLSF